MDAVTAQLKQWATNFQRNATHMFDEMSLTKWIRIIAAVGAYLLLRPYLIKLGSKMQHKEHEQAVQSKQQSTTTQAKISPNSLRGQVEVPEDTESDGEEGDTTATDTNWGKKARKRQRQTIKKILEAQEEMLENQQADDDDKDIQDLLLDYDEEEWAKAGANAS